MCSIDYGRETSGSWFVARLNRDDPVSQASPRMLPTKALSLISAFLAPSVSSSNPRFKDGDDKPSPRTSTSLSSQVGSRSKTSSSAEVGAIVFSKDRPGQLFSCLKSMADNVEGLNTVSVVYATSNCEEDQNGRSTIRSRYREVGERLYGVLDINWICEDDFDDDDDSCFIKALVEALRRMPSSVRFVMFQVDDAVHYSTVNVSKMCSMSFDAKETLLSVHLKLWRGATRCHPANGAEMIVPPLQATTALFGVFERSRGTLDWDYPFDLSGGMYRRDQIQALFAHLTEASSSSSVVRTPNRLEVEGNAFMRAMFQTTQPESACLASSHPAMSIVTINRVQTEFPNPVYDLPSWMLPAGEATAVDRPWTALTDLLFDNNIDYDAYRRASGSFTSCHIGDLLLLPHNDKDRRLLPQASSSPMLLSVIIPCRNAERTLKRALESVEADLKTIADLQNRAEIVLVDDASEDATPWIAQDYKRRFSRFNVQIVLRPKSAGVADCLDDGLRHCRGEFVFRMDADDVNLEGRIARQLREMRLRPRLGALGTGANVIASTPTTTVPSVYSTTGRSTPVGVASVAWTLFFYCPLVHPSVCLRRQAWVDAGGYAGSESSSSSSSSSSKTFFKPIPDPSSSSSKTSSFTELVCPSPLSSSSSSSGQRPPVRMEDYELWLRMLDGNRWLMDNIDFVGIDHFKHPRSVTSKWTQQERDLTQARIALGHAKLRAPSLLEVPESAWAVVCRPDRGDRDTVLPYKTDILEGLEELRQSVEDQFGSLATLNDLAFVRRDCIARKAELVVLTTTASSN